MDAASALLRERRLPKPLDLALYVELPLIFLGFIAWNIVSKGWSSGWAGDFRIFRTAAHALVHGHSPYVQPTAHLLAGDTTEADEIQKLLLEAGIDSELEPEEEADALAVLVPEDKVEEAHDAIEALTEPDDIIADA